MPETLKYVDWWIRVVWIFGGRLPNNKPCLVKKNHDSEAPVTKPH